MEFSDFIKICAFEFEASESFLVKQYLNSFMDDRHSQLRITLHYVISLKYIHILNFVTSSTLVAIVTHDIVRLVQSQG